MILQKGNGLSPLGLERKLIRTTVSGTNEDVFLYLHGVLLISLSVAALSLGVQILQVTALGACRRIDDAVDECRLA